MHCLLATVNHVFPPTVIGLRLVTWYSGPGLSHLAIATRTTQYLLATLNGVDNDQLSDVKRNCSHLADYQIFRPTSPEGTWLRPGK